MRLRAQATCMASYLKRMRTAKFFFILSFATGAFFLLWIQIVMEEYAPVNETLIEEAVINIGKDFRYTDVYRKTTFLPQDLKYILLWTRRDFSPLSFLEDGQRSFLKNNCSVVNCYVTANKRFFGRNYSRFDAIAFNGRNMKPYHIPRNRSPHQKYIFFNMESSDNYPVCHSKYDGFFNFTATYKLDSDIPLPYIMIKNRNGKVVGPKTKMRWEKNMRNIDMEYMNRMENKTKAAAWFVSHCNTKSKREDLVKNLHEALYPYGYSIEVYGKCGQLKCSKDENSDCNSMLRRDYFFYLSLENSFAEDYVTEKLLTALDNDVVPIVFGGADYSRFLPPGSYIDARKQKLHQLAATIDRLAHFPKAYSQYFRWKQYYTYHDPSKVENVCKICEVLNDKTLMEKSTIHHNFRAWWNPNYKRAC